MKSAITAQSAQSHLGNNKTLAQLKVCIVMSIHNMGKVVVLNMLIVLFALIAHFITFFVASLGAHNVTEHL